MREQKAAADARIAPADDEEQGEESFRDRALRRRLRQRRAGGAASQAGDGGPQAAPDAPSEGMRETERGLDGKEAQLDVTTVKAPEGYAGSWKMLVYRQPRHDPSAADDPHPNEPGQGRVHLYFAANPLDNSADDDAHIHGLRGAVDPTPWTLIVLPSFGGQDADPKKGVKEKPPVYPWITQANVLDCLALVGQTGYRELRLTSHSRGGRCLAETLAKGGLNLAGLERVNLLDDFYGDDGYGKDANVERQLKAKGIKPELVRHYDVDGPWEEDAAGNPTPKLKGDTAIDLTDYHGNYQSYLGAIGCARAILDRSSAKVGPAPQKTVSELVAERPEIVKQLGWLADLPPLGRFVSQPLPGAPPPVTPASGATDSPGAEPTSAPAEVGKVYFKDWCDARSDKLLAIIAEGETDPERSLLAFIDTFQVVDLIFGKFRTAAHHFFPAEFAHELFE